MTVRSAGLLLIVYLVAAGCLAFGLWALGRGDDWLGLVLAGAGAAALRAVSKGAHVIARGAG